MGFIRRYTSDPGLAEILAIEGVVIIDREPPAVLSGTGSGHATCVGEFEDGPFETPTEVSSGDDLVAQFGSFGYTYEGVTSQNPCARARRADGALTPEYWNGNGFISLVNKRFARLSVVRVDTSVGEVQFRRQAFVTSTNPLFSYPLSNGQTLVLNNGTTDFTATFNGAVAARASAAGTYPSTFVGGESVTITIDEGTDQQIGPVTVVFQSTDQTQAACIARINQFLGYTAAVSTSATVMTISGRVPGTAGNVRVNAVSGVLVTTATGLSVGVTAGTGNVGNISQVTPAEIATVVAAVASTPFRIVVDAQGRLRAYNTTTTAGAEIIVGAASTATALGFVLGEEASNSVADAGTIPAGTRVRTAGGVEWVTMQRVDVEAANPGPYSVKVRPADDDGTTAGAATGTVTVVPHPIALGAFAVANLLPLSAALTEAQIDAKYVAAFNKTLSRNAVTRTTNLIWSARQSNVCRSTVRNNAQRASSEGLQGRMSIMRPPLGTRRSVALSTSAQPGVGAYRYRGNIYAYPGVTTFVPQIAAVGLDGGDGFTADGIIDTGFDSWVASVCSQLPPEENPGQMTEFMQLALGIERGNPDVQDLQEADYRAFRAGGIAAPNLDDGTMTIQSGVTSVDPAVSPNLRNIARQRMAYFIQDTLAQRYKSFSKKLTKRQRRAQVLGETNGFLSILQSPSNEDSQRIDNFSIDGKSANTPELLALGLFRVRVCVRTLSSMDVILLDTTIGETVTIEDASV